MDMGSRSWIIAGRMVLILIILTMCRLEETVDLHMMLISVFQVRLILASRFLNRKT